MTTELTELDDLDVLDTAAAATALSEGRDYVVSVADARDLAFALDLPIVGGRGYCWTAAAVSRADAILDDEDADLDEEAADEDEDTEEDEDDDAES